MYIYNLIGYLRKLKTTRNMCSLLTVLVVWSSSNKLQTEPFPIPERQYPEQVMRLLRLASSLCVFARARVYACLTNCVDLFCRSMW